MLSATLYRGSFKNLYGRALRRLRVNVYDMSQIEMAKKLGCSAATLSNMELGKIELSQAAKELLDKHDNDAF
jgi:DNA-binding transcriptional regulator YiaG